MNQLSSLFLMIVLCGLSSSISIAVVWDFRGGIPWQSHQPQKSQHAWLLEETRAIVGEGAPADGTSREEYLAWLEVNVTEEFARSIKGEELLFKTVVRECSKGACFLLRRGANPHARTRWGCFSILSHAVISRDVAVTELLLELKADADVREPDGSAPLAAAAASSNCEKSLAIARLLLENGAKTNVMNAFRQTPLSQAVKNAEDASNPDSIAAQFVALLKRHEAIEAVEASAALVSKQAR